MNQVRYGDEVPEIFHPTMKLRWQNRQSGPGHVLVLQQAWRNISAGELEWRDVEVVEDE
jgi:hypothetical protein